MRRVPILILGLTVTVLGGCSHRCHSGCQPFKRPFRNRIISHRQTSTCETCGFEVLHATENSEAQNTPQPQQLAEPQPPKQAIASVKRQSPVKQKSPETPSVGAYSPIDYLSSPTNPLNTWPAAEPPISTPTKPQKLPVEARKEVKTKLPQLPVVAEIPEIPAISTNGSLTPTETQLPAAKDNITPADAPTSPASIGVDTVDAPSRKVQAQPVSAEINKPQQPIAETINQPELELKRYESQRSGDEIELPAAVEAPTDPIVLQSQPVTRQDTHDQPLSEPHHSVAQRIESPKTGTHTPQHPEFRSLPKIGNTDQTPAIAPASESPAPTENWKRLPANDDLISTSYQSPVYYEPAQRIVPHEMAKLKRDQSPLKPAAIQEPSIPKVTIFRLHATTPLRQGQSLPPIVSIKRIQPVIVDQHPSAIATVEKQMKKVIAKTPKLPALDVNKLEATIHNVQRQANESSNFNEIIDR